MGSQSSGYTTSNEGTKGARTGGTPMGHTPPHLQVVARQRNNLIEVPQDVHVHMLKQHQLFTFLASAHDMWNEADRYTREDNAIKGKLMAYGFKIYWHLNPFSLKLCSTFQKIVKTKLIHCLNIIEHIYNKIKKR